MKHKILVGSIILMLITTVVFAKGINETEKNLSIIGAPVFQTQDGVGDLPFVGFDTGLSVKVYPSNDVNVWVRALYQRTWPFNLATPEFLTTHIRNTLSLGPEFVLNLDGFLLGLGPGFMYRITDYDNGTYDSEYGFYVEGFTQIEIWKWLVLQPTIDIKYVGSLEVGIAIRTLLRFF